MKPFDLEKALAGKPVVTMSGYAVTDLHFKENVTEYPLVAVVDNSEWLTFTKDGECYRGSAGYLDLCMKSETRTIGGIEVPSPIKPEEGQKYWYIGCWGVRLGAYRGTEKTHVFERYASEEDAQANLDALLMCISNVD